MKDIFGGKLQALTGQQLVETSLIDIKSPPIDIKSPPIDIKSYQASPPGMPENQVSNISTVDVDQYTSGDLEVLYNNVETTLNYGKDILDEPQLMKSSLLSNTILPPFELLKVGPFVNAPLLA